LYLGQKTIQFQRRTLFRVLGFGAFGLASPCPKIVPAPLSHSEYRYRQHVASLVPLPRRSMCFKQALF